MMKNIYYIMSLLLLTACSNEVESIWEEQPATEIALTSVVEQGQTRSTDMSLQSTQIVAGQSVGVYITGADETMSNGQWLVGGNGTMTNLGDKIYWSRNNSISIKAYQPYMSDNSLSNNSFFVQTDQSTDEGYLKSDLLYANTTVEPSLTLRVGTGSTATTTIPLTFYHKLAKVMVQLVTSDASFLKGAVVYVCNTAISTDFDPTNLEIKARDFIYDIKASTITDNTITAAAIIIPQTIKAGTKLICVKIGEDKYYYSLKNTVTYESGYSYLYTLNITPSSSAKAQATDFRIEEWNE